MKVFEGITVETKLMPFGTPNFVVCEGARAERQQGWRERPTIALKDLPAVTLSKLCDQFRAEVFAKADKMDPAL